MCALSVFTRTRGWCDCDVEIYFDCGALEKEVIGFKVYNKKLPSLLRATLWPFRKSRAAYSVWEHVLYYSSSNALKGS